MNEPEHVLLNLLLIRVPKESDLGAAAAAAEEQMFTRDNGFTLPTLCSTYRFVGQLWQMIQTEKRGIWVLFICERTKQDFLALAKYNYSAYVLH